MRYRSYPLLTLLLAGALFLFLPGSGFAQDRSIFTVGVMGGLGGTSDTQPEPDFDNAGWQVLFNMQTEPRTYFGVRAGQMELTVDENDLFDSTLRYLTLGGEYRFTANFYDSGLYFALGTYDLDGDFLVDDDNAFGLSIGSTGEFRISKRFSFLLELSGHYADLDYAQLFFMGHAGITFHF